MSADKRSNRPLRNLIGLKYGALLVVDELAMPVRPNGRQRRYLLCKCDCGNTKLKGVTWDNLRSGAINNCGCLSTRHGGTGTKLHGAWHGIVQRCTDKNYQAYNNYGGRGIKLCKSWRLFKNFRAWANSSGYKEGLTIERINNNGPYSPDNCTWIPPHLQGNNKRNNRWVLHGGRKLTMSEVSRLLGVGLSTISYRLNHNLPVEGTRNAIQKSKR